MQDESSDDLEHQRRAARCCESALAVVKGAYGDCSTAAAFQEGRLAGLMAPFDRTTARRHARSACEVLTVHFGEASCEMVQELRELISGMAH